MPRKFVDWEAVEVDVRAGMPMSAICDKHDTTLRAIRDKARAGGWKLQKVELASVARKRARMKEQEEVKEQQPQVVEAIEAQIDAGNFNPLLFQSTAALIENAANVIYAHRKDIRAAKDVQDRLVEELAFMTTEQSKLTDIIDMATADVDANNRGQLRAKMFDLLSIHARTRTYEKLTAAMERMQNMERRAFGIKDDTKPEEPMDRLSDTALEQRLAAFGIQLRLPKPH